MFDKSELQSAEYYNRRYQNFSTLVIVPIFLFICFIVIFGVFTKKELVIKTVGQLEPHNGYSIVQSTTNNYIDKNYLLEGKYVSKGDTLLTYQSIDTTEDNHFLTNKIVKSKDKISLLEIYKDSVLSGVDKFNGNGKYGYSDKFKQYLSQRNELSEEFNNQNKNQETANEQVSNQKNSLLKRINELKYEVNQYNDIKNAVMTGSSDNILSNKYKYLYDSYNVNSKNLTGNDKEKLRQQIVGEIEQSIDSLQDKESDITVQINSISSSNLTSKDILVSKLESLKEGELSSILDILEKENTNYENLKLQLIKSKDSEKDNHVLALKSGYIHLVSNFKGVSYIPKGSQIALIYPNIRKSSKVDVNFIVPSDEISGITKNDKVRFMITKKVSKPIIISGKITKVDTAATSTKKGSVFNVVARLDTSNLDYRSIKYGMVGNTTIITGEKTWFNYLKDYITDK